MARTRYGLLAAALLLCAGCAAVPAVPAGGGAGRSPDASSPAPTSTSPPGKPRTRPQPTPVADPGHAVEPPGPRRGPLLPDDMLVFAQEPLGTRTVARIDALGGVDATLPMSFAQVAVENRVVNVAAVDPGAYRSYTPVESAQLQEVWDRVAGGEVALDPSVKRRTVDRKGYVRLGNGDDAPRIHVGAWAPQVEQVGAVVNPEWAEDLGMVEGNALLVSTGSTAPEKVRPRIRRIVGEEASVLFLAPEVDVSATQTAVLTGGSVAAAVGTFSYTVLGGGRIAPDPRWVAANIRTEQVPILGSVTCHRAMLPQLRAVMIEIVQRGLADEIHPDEYAGCYYPRYIAGTTSLSLHSFGIALDVNVPGNLRGTVGEIDRDVVAIFKKWGFAWGGDWSYTDPMHFEMSAVVQAR
jgi:hypothetical protein